MIKLLLVDDHELIRTGLRSIIETASDLSVIGEASTGEEAISFVDESLPDVILMDIHMPGIGGIEATRKIVAHWPEMKVIALTIVSDDPFPNKLLDAGAVGYLTKGSPADEMFKAIRTVMNDQYYISSDVAQKLTLGKFEDQKASSPLSGLSAREMQVMLMITQGKSINEVSESLFLSPKTVSTYRYRLYEKLDVINDVELTHLAIRYGLLDQP